MATNLGGLSIFNPTKKYKNQDHFEPFNNIYMQLLLQINLKQVLEPSCQSESPRSSKEQLKRRYLQENSEESDLLSQTNPAYWCRVKNLSSITLF
jgi:hypothetical protein